MRFRGCLQVILKFLNLLLFVIGVAMIIYSVWMLNKIKGEHHGLNSGRRILIDSPLRLHNFELPTPWFVYAFMGVGIFVCIITFTGYVAAEAASGCCLCCYSVCMGVFLVLQAALAATIFFDKSWEQDFPKDSTGQVHRIRRFVEHNFGFCKWIALTVVILEGLCLLFGMILRAAIGDFRKAGDESDDEYEYVAAPSRGRQQFGPPSRSTTSSFWSPKLQKTTSP